MWWCAYIIPGLLQQDGRWRQSVLTARTSCPGVSSRAGTRKPSLWKERTKFQELSSDLHMSIVACSPYPHTDSTSKIKKNKSGPQGHSWLIRIYRSAIYWGPGEIMTLDAVGGTELQVQHRGPKADPAPPTWFPSCSLLSLCFFLSCCEFILFSTKFT